MTQGPSRETRIIRCPACKRYYRIGTAVPAAGTRLRCTKCGEVFTLHAGAQRQRQAAAAAAAPPSSPPPEAATAAAGQVPAAAAPEPGRGRVLVATDGHDFQALIGEVLGEAGFELLPVRTGEEAWERLRAWSPNVALLDVALPGVPAFELCDRVRAVPELQGTGLILIASVFQQTRYKRAPTSLYGADDYIEKHHIRDWLPEKVARLLPVPASGPLHPPASATAPAAAAAPAAHEPAVEDRERESLIREELFGLLPQEHRGLERLRENLRRYARIIVSDIALYNQELVERGIAEGTFTELLGKELEEGRQLYLTRVPPSARGTDHFAEAVRDFIARRSTGQGARTVRPGGRRVGP